MSLHDPSKYGPKISKILAGSDVQPLGPGTPNRTVRGQLDGLNIESAFASHTIKDRNMARCCLAGVWLYHNFLDESHKISQRIDTPTGSYWHGLMHRREPDYSNAKYWFRRADNHQAYRAVHESVQALRTQDDIPDDVMALLRQPEWDPFRFIDICEFYEGGELPGTVLCQDIQNREWWALFNYCFRAAI